MQSDSVVRDKCGRHNRLSFVIELSRQGTAEFPGELQALLDECSGRVVCLRPNFMFFGDVVNLPPVTMAQPSKAALEAALTTICGDMPFRRHLCRITVYAVSFRCLS